MGASNWLAKLGLDKKGKLAAYRRTSSVEPLFAYLKDFSDAFKDTSLNDTLAEQAIEVTSDLLPSIGHALASSWAPIKFVFTLAKKLTEITDAEDLGFLAFSLSFGECLALAIQKHAPGSDVNLGAAIDKDTTMASFTSYCWEDRANHAFIVTASRHAEKALKETGLNADLISQILLDARLRFPARLRTLLSSPDGKDLFSRYSAMIQEKQSSAAFWSSHHELLRSEYFDKRVLEVEPFSLSDVFVPVDVAAHSWGELRGSNVDPMVHKPDSTEDILSSIMKLLLDKSFKDAIVIQGPAGSGKSTFCLKLANDLLSLGLCPLRIKFRDLKMTVTNLMEAISDAARHKLPPGNAKFDLTEEAILEESLNVGGCDVCPIVLILDGWDEVSFSSSTTYQQRVEQLLEQCRDNFINRPNHPPLRVIITGRPSEQVYSSSFLRAETKVLTIRPLSSETVDTLISKVLSAYNTDEAKPSALRALQKQYSSDSNTLFRKSDGVHELLGQPFLAYLVTKLLVSNPELSTKQVLNSTWLMRTLTDHTCESSAKAEKVEASTTIPPGKLRLLLRGTAVACSTYNREYIPFKELKFRLDDLSPQLKEILQLSSDDTIPNLMVNFFFKGQREDLGAEFLHKSFREYLLAESIWEFLKSQSQKLRRVTGTPRTTYWDQFTDDRDAFVRQLGKYVSPHWLSPEVRGHLTELIKMSDDITEEHWSDILRLLADTWDWWLEGGNQRPFKEVRGESITWGSETAVMSWLKWNTNYAVGVSDSVPIRTVTLDAHFGDALFLLFHETLRFARESGVSSIPKSIGKFESNGFFHPFGQWAMETFARINASGYRPSGPFPRGIHLFKVSWGTSTCTLERLECTRCLIYGDGILTLVASYFDKCAIMARTVLCNPYIEAKNAINKWSVNEGAFSQPTSFEFYESPGEPIIMPDSMVSEFSAEINARCNPDLQVVNNKVISVVSGVTFGVPPP